MVLAAPNFMPGLIDTDSHIIYCPMPLYHSLGGGVGVGLGLIYGHSVVLRKKFSPSVFWQDCAKYKCTVSRLLNGTSMLKHCKETRS